MLAAALNLVRLLQALDLVVSNQFKLDGLSVFSFSKLIYLRKKVQVVLCWEQVSELFNLGVCQCREQPCQCESSSFLFYSTLQIFDQLLIRFNLKSPYGFPPALFRRAVRLCRPLPAHWNKCVCSSLPWPFSLLQVSLIWCWKQFSLVQLEDHFQQVCLLIPPSFFKSCFYLCFPDVAPGHIFHT